MTTTLSPELLNKLIRKGYKREEVEAVERWVAYCASVLSVCPEHLEALKDSTRNLARFAQVEWNAMQADGKHLPSLWTGQLQNAFPLGEDAAEVFVMLTGDVLLAGADGPQVTAMWMGETLDMLAVSK